MGDQSERFVLVAGSANADYVVRASGIPTPGETVLGSDLAVFPGGKGANQAVALARAGGVKTAMLLALGDDASGRMLEASLSDTGVSLHVKRSSRSTGAALITVSDAGENAITVAPGANADLMPADLPDLADTAWLVLQLEIPIATVAAYAQAARSRGAKVLLNAAPIAALPAALLGDVDVLVVNEDELAALAGPQGTVAARLSRVPVSAVVVTLGGRGACGLANGETVLQPAFVVTPVDTTAAGDTFCGVLAAGLMDGLALSDAMRRAAAAGALATTRAGAQSSIPTRAEVETFLATARENDRDALARYCGIAPAAD